MATSQQYSLKWNNYYKHITYAFDSLRLQDDFVDVTLCCDGKKIKAHKVLLSACSGYFKEIFKENPCPHPVIIFKFIKYDDLHAIIEFMYQGEVNVQQEALQSFLQTAELLAVQGLTAEEKSNPVLPKTSTKEIEDKIKKLPTSIKAVTENNTQTSIIDIQGSINVVPIGTVSSKKRKITFTDDDEDVYNETVGYSNTKDEMKSPEQYIPTMAVELPETEYIEVSESKDMNVSQTQESQPSQDTTTQTTSQFSSEYEILSETDIDKFDTSGNITGQVYTVQEKSGTNQTQKGTQGLPQKSITCILCNRHFQSGPALKRHKISKHTSRNIKYDCNLCQKSFKTKWSLSTHNSRFHRETKIKENIKLDISF